MIDANFKASLYITNDLRTDALTVNPALYLSNGVHYTLAPITLEPSGTAIVDINQELAKQGLAPYATLSGYVEVRYSWPWPAICATVRNLDTVHSLIFTHPLQTPPDAVSAPDTDPQAHQSRRLEGMWWKQEANVSGFVGLSNVTDKPIDATLRVWDSGTVTSRITA